MKLKKNITNKENKNAKGNKKVKDKNCVKKTIKKKTKQNVKTYTQENLKSALNEIGNGQTLRQIAEVYGVPKSTLFNKFKNFSTLDCKLGAPTVLTKKEEEDIVSWIKYCADKGCPVRKNQLLDSIQKYIIEVKRDNPFVNNRPGKHWYKGFMQRHSDISLRVAQNLTSTRASVQESDLRQWFQNVKNNLEEKNLLNVSPDRIFNCDESSFMLCPDNDAVLAQKGRSSVYNIVGGSEKECLTVLVTASASGVLAPPMILFECKKLPNKNILNKIPKGWGVGLSESGWMTSDSFYCFVSNVFFKWLQQQEIVFPVVLYLDGHSSHLSLPLCKFCKEHNIELVPLYPNATHLLQPLDVALFHPLKSKYKDVLLQWRIENKVINFKKDMFATVLNISLQEIDLKNIVINGFRKCGLYPFNPDAVDYNVLDKKRKKKNAVTLQSSEKEDGNVVDNKNFLEYFETNFLDINLIKEFEESIKISKEDHDQQILHKESLFEVWCALRKMSGQISKNLDSAESNVNNNLQSSCETIAEVHASNNLDTETDVTLSNILPNESTDEQILIVFNENDIADPSNIMSDMTTEVNSYEIVMLDNLNTSELASINHVSATTDGKINPTVDLKVISQQINLDSGSSSFNSLTNSNFESTDLTREENCTNTALNYTTKDKNQPIDISTNSQCISRTKLINAQAGFIEEPQYESCEIANSLQSYSITNKNECQGDLNALNCISSEKDLNNCSKSSSKEVQNNSATIIKCSIAELNDDAANVFPLDLSSENSNQGTQKDPFADAFIYPNPDLSKKSKNKIPTGFLLDDIIDHLNIQQKIKKEKTDEVLQKKKDQEKRKIIKEKETQRCKEYQERKKQLNERKKETNEKLKLLKKNLKKESDETRRKEFANEQLDLQNQFQELQKLQIEIEKEDLRFKLQFKENMA